MVWDGPRDDLLVFSKGEFSNTVIICFKDFTTTRVYLYGEMGNRSFSKDRHNFLPCRSMSYSSVWPYTSLLQRRSVCAWFWPMQLREQHLMTSEAKIEKVRQLMSCIWRYHVKSPVPLRPPCWVGRKPTQRGVSDGTWHRREWSFQWF